MESGSAIVPASLAGINAESDSTAFVNLPRFYALGNRSSVNRQDVGHGGKGDGRNVVPKDILGPSQSAGGRHVDLARNQSESTAFAGPKHEAMGT
jgi:hypothetical protein